MIYAIPRDIFLRVCEKRPLTARKRQLEKKIELLHDVEYRILYYMADLARTFGAKASGSEYAIPLPQGELASLIGATREPLRRRSTRWRAAA